MANKNLGHQDLCQCMNVLLSQLKTELNAFEKIKTQQQKQDDEKPTNSSPSKASKKKIDSYSKMFQLNLEKIRVFSQKDAEAYEKKYDALFKAEAEVLNERHYVDKSLFLSELPTLSSLNSLFLTGIDLDATPIDLSVFANSLVNLSLNRCSLTSLAEISGLQSCTKLTSISFCDNSLSETGFSFFPFASLNQLTHLYLNGNQFTYILPGFSSLTTLEILSMSDNKLSSLANLDHLGKLSSLILSNNLLKEVPKCIFELQSLKVLDLSHNQLDEYPITLETDPLIFHVLDLQGNPFLLNKKEQSPNENVTEE